MEIHAYSELYLSHAMENMAVMTDYGINAYDVPASVFFSGFIASGIASQFELGNPRYVVGHSGAELADMVVGAIFDNPPVIKEDGQNFNRTPEYWAGWVLCYYQWRSCSSFAYMSRHGLTLERVISMYHPLHEADPEKFCAAADAIIKEHEAVYNPIRNAREILGMTQKDLAETSGISLRMIRAYEQKSQDLSKAEYGTVLRLARSLKLQPQELF